MSDNNTLATTNTILAEFTGGSSSEVEMMIGIGIVKDSDAVFFQYLGDEMQPQALTMPTSGRPLTRLANIRLTGISIAENVGEFNSTKLNLYVQSTKGKTILLTSGLTTLWSQYALTGLMQMYQTYQMDQTFTLDSWKGTSKMRPCFSAIRVQGEKLVDEKLKEQLLEAKADGDQNRTEQLLRSAVSAINMAIGGNVEEVQVSDVTDTEVPF
jgi:hypothetical protein